MNFKFSIFNFKFLAGLGLCLVLVLINVQTARADLVIDNGINFLKSKQDATGRINTGFSAPSQWSAIAFASYGIDVATVKNPTVSLKDFLLTDIPTEPSAATDWETRILAIVAIGDNPSSFGGMNFVSKLEGFYNNGQIGDTCSLNDDIFGLLALIASGSTSSTQIKQDVLIFILSKQDPADGGFGFSAPGCDWYSTSSDMTGAAAAALQKAKDVGFTNAGLDEAIERAKNYLLANQNADGGFGYFGSSDTDTTGWVLIALNALGMKDSDQAASARAWLISQQSTSDGGFLAFDWGSSTYLSNATTTAQAMIALAGKGWILRIYTAPVTPILTPTNTPTLTPTPTPTTNPGSSNNSSPANTPTPTPTSTPTPTKALPVQNNSSPFFNSIDDEIPSPTPKEEVLGTATEDDSDKDSKVAGVNSMKPYFVVLFSVLGVGSLAVYLLRKKSLIN